MTALFKGPKLPPLIPPVDPTDTQNRAGGAIARQLAGGGTNADQLTSTPSAMAAVGGARMPSLTGIS